MSEHKIRKQLLKYIQDAQVYDVGTLTGETLLFENGVFDSMGLLLLIEFLKEEFQMQTSDEESVPENFESINAIVDVVDRKRCTDV